MFVATHVARPYRITACGYHKIDSDLECMQCMHHHNYYNHIIGISMQVVFVVYM